MSAAQLNAESLAANQAAALLRQVTLSQAARFAREGSYSAAEELLSGLLAADAPDLASLDLLARVRAQQGAFWDAASLWRKVQQLDPHHLGAVAGLERLRTVHQQPLWYQPLIVPVVGLAVAFSCVLVFNRQTRRQTTANTQLEQRITELAKLEALTGRQQVQSVSAQVEAMRAGQAKAETTLAVLGGFSGKLDAWARTQEAQAQVISSQVDSLRQTFARDLASTKVDFEQRLATLQAQEIQLAAEHDAAAQGISNQVVALRGAVDRERALTAQLEQSRSATEKLQVDYRTLESRHAALAKQIGIPAKPPDVVIDIPGATASVSGNEIIVAFDGGLFDHGTHLKPGAKDRLLAVAKTLIQSSDTLQIQVVGFADDDRAFLNWTAPWESSLALDRASAVVTYFIGLGLFQAEKLSAASGDRQQRPFASDSVQSRLKNRTVVLRVTGSGQNQRRGTENDSLPEDSPCGLFSPYATPIGCWGSKNSCKSRMAGILG